MMTENPVRTKVWGNIATVAAPLLLTAALFLPLARELAPLDRWAISVLAVALLVLGFSLRRGTVAFGILAFALVTGTGAQLYLTEPLWFPSLRLRPHGMRDAIMIAVILGEAAVAAAMLGRVNIRALVTDIFGRFGTIRVVLFLGLTFALSVPILTVDRNASTAYLTHFLAAAGLIILHIAVLLAMAQVPGPVSGTHRLSPVVHALTAILASLALSYFAFGAMPHVTDEVAYLFQARTLAGGGVTVPAPDGSALAGLDYDLLEITGGRWYATTLPGWPAALAVALTLGVPWLLNPLLAGASVLLAYGIARAKAGRDVADIAAVLMAFSPLFLAAGGSLMPHTLILFLTLLAWWLILGVEARASGTSWRLTVAGLATGWVFCASPLDGVIIGGFTGIWLVYAVNRGTILRRILPYALGCTLAGGLLLIFNAGVTGSPLTLPHDLWAGHGLPEAFGSTVNLLVSLQLELFGWPVGSLALLIAFFLWQDRRNGFDRAMVALLMIIMIVMARGWYSEIHYIGPRHWFVAAFPIIYLSARGCEALYRRIAGTNGAGTIRMETGVWLLCAIGLCVFLPWRGVAKYHEYGNFHPEFRSAAATGIFGNAVVIFRQTGDDGSAFMLNDPRLGDDAPIFLRDTGMLDEAALRAAFPGREILRFTPGWQARDPSGRDISGFVRRMSGQ